MNNQKASLSRLKDEALVPKTYTKWMEPLVYLLPLVAVAIYIALLIEEALTKNPIPLDTQRSAYGWISLIMIVWIFITIMVILDRVPLFFQRKKGNDSSTATASMTTNEINELSTEAIALTGESNDAIQPSIETEDQSIPSPSIPVPLAYPEEFQGCNEIFEDLIKEGYCNDSLAGHLDWVGKDALLAYFIYFCSIKMEICKGDRIIWAPFITVFGLNAKHVEQLRSTISKAISRSNDGKIIEYKYPKDHEKIERIVEDNC